MKLTVDLHAHSPYAGATGKTDFERLHFVMKYKGIDVYGSGDILLKKWEDELNAGFDFDESRQMWKLPDNMFLMPQTEVIITLPYLHNPKKRKLFHLVILFSHISQVHQLRKILTKHGSKLTIGRPFVAFETIEAFQNFFGEIKHKIDGDISLIPAHVMTPEGILGGKNPVDSVSEIFGSSIESLDAIESGLSADPKMLASISTAHNLPIVSFSDSHSAAFNKLGREFSQINVSSCCSDSVVNSVNSGDIVKTVEFPPFEGRYYLTGHRADRQGHEGKSVVYEDHRERPQRCPICSKQLTPGVCERVDQLSKQFPKAEKCQDFIYQIPLIEIISKVLGVGVKTKKSENLYMEIVSHIGKESRLWLEDGETELSDHISAEIKNGIKNIKNNQFKIVSGYDGTYGSIEF